MDRGLGGTDRLINPSMRCSTWRGNDLTKLNRQVQLWVCPRFEPPTPHLCISYTGREPVFLLSFIPSASCRSTSFTILSPSPLQGVETPQQVQATSVRSRISTKACSPITCVTGCATKSQLNKFFNNKSEVFILALTRGVYRMGYHTCKHL